MNGNSAETTLGCHISETLYFVFHILITGKMVLEKTYLCDTVVLTLDKQIVQILKRIFQSILLTFESIIL